MIMTLCYLEKDDKYLMLHRTKKEKDVNKGKWIGVGGKLEKRETPEECVIREIREETSLNAWEPDFRGIVVFNYNDNPSEYMYLYTCANFTGQIGQCDEGDLKWVEKDRLFDLNLWEGDKIFLTLIKKKTPFFYLTLNYKDDVLLDYSLEFEEKKHTIFEVFVPEDHVEKIVKALGRYDLLTEGCYGDVYATLDVTGHWTSLPGANPYDGEVGKASCEPEKLMKFRVKREFKELAYKLIKENHPYEVPVINMID